MRTGTALPRARACAHGARPAAPHATADLLLVRHLPVVRAERQVHVGAHGAAHGLLEQLRRRDLRPGHGVGLPARLCVHPPAGHHAAQRAAQADQGGVPDGVQLAVCAQYPRVGQGARHLLRADAPGRRAGQHLAAGAAHLPAHPGRPRHGPVRGTRATHAFPCARADAIAAHPGGWIACVAPAPTRLLPTAYFIPLRVQCIKAVIDLCEQTGFYAPVAPPLLEVRAALRRRLPPSDTVTHDRTLRTRL